MRSVLFILAFVISSTAIAQKIEKKLGSFNQLKTYDGLTITLIPSKTNKAVITGKYADKVQLVTKNDLLKIKLNIEKYHSGKGTHVDLYYNHLYLIDANEGSFIKSNGVVEAIDLDINAQEGAEIDVTIKAKRLTARSISGATIEISGNATNQDITVNSGANYHAKQLKSEQANINSSTGAMAKVYVTDVAKATVKTGGNIRIYGNPKVVDQKKILGGSITIVD
ncbi:head GIN domain-containing protein [Pseudofulvibacter geojedonensis]|uniref:Head GIN domain-containing protein n=1 Tax=Pseudofulvibacter geojedonensis TaxID=1123758 RepID=A0ABW3I5J3_9FLAO